jgi:CRP/FNR family transcriptional regulator, cyclic AMP receptor protein
VSRRTGTPRADTPGLGLARNDVEPPFLGSGATSTRKRPSVPSLPGVDRGSKQAPVVPKPDALAKLPLFRGLTTEQLSKLGPLMRSKESPAGAEIITASQPGEIAYVILDGSAKVHIDQPDGSDVILAVLGTGAIVGEMSLADSLGRSASVTTLEPSRFLLIDRAGFWASLREMPMLAYNLMNILSRRLRMANLHTQSLVRLDVYGRVAGQLLALAREYGEATPNGSVLIPLRLTQSDLASMVGASRVRVNQALSYYKKREYLSVDGDRRIVIHDPAALGRRCR